MPFLRKYGTGTGSDVIIPMIVAGDTDHATSSNWTPATGDVKVSKDGGAAANIGTLPTYITSIGWKFVFSDAELQCARLNVQVTDSATKAVEDQHFAVETHGNASAMYAVDFDDAVRLGLTALPNAAADAAGGLPISDAGGLDLDGRLDAAISSRLASTSVPTNFADLAITASTGRVTVGTNNDKTGYSISGTINTLDALDTVQDTQHSTTQSAISALNNLGTADIDARLAAIGLDHLVSTSVAGTDVADNSIVAKLVSSSATADWDDFVNTTDSLQAVRDRGDAAWTTATGFSTHTAADVRTEIDTNSTQLAAIVEDTNELQADWANGGRLDLLVDAILEDTGTTLPAAIPSAATITNSVLTTQMTESYADPGAAPTLTQAVCWLYQDVQEAAVSGTTKTVKKLDQSTTAGTVTLDDANTPTSLTRAT